MRKTRLEVADPQEWLATLAADADGFSRLVRESGGMARAAYRLARARCIVLFDSTPQLEDLQAATALLSSRLGGHSVLPITSLLPGPLEAARASSNFPAAPAVQSTRQEVQPIARSFPPPPPSSLRRSKSRPEASRASL